MMNFVLFMVFYSRHCNFLPYQISITSKKKKIYIFNLYRVIQKIFVLLPKHKKVKLWENILLFL